MRAIDLTGRKFNRLTVVQDGGTYRPPSGQFKKLWRCRCDCGCFTVVTAQSLKEGRTKSCGCLNREKAAQRKRTHGESKTPTYRVWASMVKRCTNPSTAKENEQYFGRGIRVCDRWRNSYARFREDMGERPSLNHSIDRINNNGGYSPDNCRWATPTQQANNTRRNRVVEFDGERLTVSQWARKIALPISRRTLHQRIHRLGWPASRAFTEPVQQGRRRVANLSH